MKRESHTGITLPIIAIASSVIVIALMLVYDPETGGWMGGRLPDDGIGQGFSNIQIIILAAALIALIAGVVFLIVHLHARKTKEEDVPKMIWGSGGGASESEIPLTSLSEDVPEETAVHPAQPETDEHLIGRLLDGDEKRLYQIIATGGGEVLQRDLVAMKIFSKAKITRLLGKLEKRGLIARERHGSTNRIKLLR